MRTSLRGKAKRVNDSNGQHVHSLLRLYQSETHYLPTSECARLPQLLNDILKLTCSYNIWPVCKLPLHLVTIQQMFYRCSCFATRL